MTLTASQPTTTVASGESRRTAALAGALYLLTFLTSVPTLVLYGPLRDHADFVLGAGTTTSVRVGAVLEVGLAISCVATAVVLFPVIRRYGESASLGFLASRVVEAAVILVGVLSVLAVLAMRDSAGDLDPAATGATTQALVAVYDGTFLLGQSLMPALSAVCLGTVLYRSGLVPRGIPALGLVGAPLLLASDVAVMWGLYEQRGVAAGLAAVPIAAWELALAVWLLTKGFRTPPRP